MRVGSSNLEIVSSPRTYFFLFVEEESRLLSRHVEFHVEFDKIFIDERKRKGADLGNGDTHSAWFLWSPVAPRKSRLPLRPRECEPRYVFQKDKIICSTQKFARFREKNWGKNSIPFPPLSKYFFQSFEGDDLIASIPAKWNQGATVNRRKHATVVRYSPPHPFLLFSLSFLRPSQFKT